MMYARNVHFNIQDGKVEEFKKLFNAEVLPILRKQKGFRDEVTMLRSHAGVALSLWDDRNAAEAFQASGYPDVVKKLTPVLDGTPKVETYDVPVTTIQHV